MTQSPPRESPAWKTPLFDQYWRLKDSVPGCLLFFRLGDFYELFGQDAVEAAPLLEVQLTSRDKGSDQPIPMCGVPAHAVDSYAERLLAKGFRIALAEQLQTPAEAKNKLVERGVIRILTPGLPVDYGRLDQRAPHWFLSVGQAPVEKVSRSAPRKLEVIAYDFLGGELFEGEVATPEDMADLLARLDPRELLLPASLLAAKSFVETWKMFDESSAFHARLTPWAGERARENLEAYLIHTQRCDRESLKALLPDARDLARLSGEGRGEIYARLPSNVFEHWAVFPELFDLLDGCGSSVGSRRLRALLSNPLRATDRIRRRQDAFALMSQSAGVLEHTREVYDFERMLGRFRVGAAAPRELLRFLQSFDAADAAIEAAPTNSNEWRAFTRDEGLADLGDVRGGLAGLRDRLRAALDVTVDATRSTSLVELVKRGFDAGFDELRDLQLNAEDWLVKFEERLRSETNIPSLKVRYNRVFGYYIEVTKTHLDKVPSSFERKQTTVGGERFTCAELRSKETEILTAGARAEARAREILESLQKEILEHDQPLRAFIDHFAWIDAVAGVQAAIRKFARYGAWVRPEVEEGEFRFTLKEARHPIVEAIAGNFVPNSLELGGPSGKRVLVLTGPNMAGKSTLMRLTGLCLLLAQCGLTVPAAGMSFAPCSGFYSRMGATDRILAGESTFMVEMKETAAILRSADAQSFILLDEIGRGTSTQDGLAIAHAVLDHIHNELKAVSIFATHYHELSKSAEALPRAVNGSMGIREWKGDLVFLRTLELAPAESSYGIFVARMAGLPKKLLARAQDFFTELHRLEEKGAVPSAQLTLDLLSPSAERTIAVPQSVPEPNPEQEARARLAAELLDEVERLDLDDLSPRAAWLALESLKERLSKA